MDNKEAAISKAVEELREYIIEFTFELVRQPSMLGEEASVLRVMEEELIKLGLEPTKVPMDPETLSKHPGWNQIPDWISAPINYEHHYNVVATRRADDEGGKSALFNGHLDIVSPEPLSRWHRDPFEPELKDGWIYTRDVGRKDKEGFIFLTDRKGEMIVSGGLNIYPGEVEQVLYQHSAVLEASVFGVPDEKWGEAVKAVIALKPGMTATESEIIEFCKKHLARYKAPKSVEFTDSLPTNPQGKILKRELREKYWAGQDKRV